MKTSESIGNLTKALVKAQAQMGGAVKGASNPFFKSSYASLPQVMEVVKGPLNDNGLIVLQPGVHRDGKNFINTVIFHESGEYISSETEVVVPTAKANDPQAHGSAQTYARRFGLQAMLFIPALDLDAEDLVRGPSKTNTAATYSGNQTVTATKVPTTNTTKTDPVALTQAAAAPPTTDEVARDELPMGHNNPDVKTVEPLKKSSFRKPAKTAPVEAAPLTEEGWE